MVLKRSVAIALVLVFSAPLLSAARDVDLTGNLEAFRVVMTEEGKETFLPADNASPSDVIEYRLTYRNDGKDPIRNIFITDPIPSGTAYIERSASTPSEGRVEFSIDSGRTYHDWPVLITRKTQDGREITTEATPEMVTHIRWVLNKMFDPESEITVTYRTLIK